MPSQSQLTKSNSSKNLAAAEDILGAVIVADSFNQRFRPLTFSSPRCLLPIVNAPAIEYSLEFLASNGVQEIYILCCAHADQLNSYISSSKWGRSLNPLVKVIVSKELRSMGDALRELDGKQILNSDFILMSGDTIARFDLQKALKEHKERREKDKNAIMTMCLRQGGKCHPSRARGEEQLFMINEKTKECVYYEPFELYPRKKRVSIDPDLFKSHPEITIRSDFIDAQIDICSLSVLALFTENFDYQELRRDFVRGVLESDLLGQSIHVHEITSGYAAKASSFQMYEAISKDVMKRWAFPLVPDNRAFGGSFLHSHNQLYKENGITLSRSALTSENVVIGRNTSIGASTKISNSAIGRNCIIGDGVIIEGAYLFDNVVIKDNVTITRSVIGRNVKVEEGIKLPTGSVLSDEVVLAKGSVLPSGAKVCHPKWVKEQASSNLNTSKSPSRLASFHDKDLILGPGTVGVPYYHDPSLDDDEEVDIRNIRMGYLEYDPSCELPELENESGVDTDADFDDSDDEEEENDWRKEVEQTLDRAFSENHTIDVAALELNTLKMAFNITFENLRQIVIPKLLSRIDLKQPVIHANELIQRWVPLIHRFTHSEDEQVNVLDIVDTECALHPEYSKYILLVLRNLYEQDVVEEDAILEWYEGLAPSSKLAELAKPFIDWLNEAEEEDDSDDDDSDEGDDDESD